MADGNVSPKTEERCPDLWFADCGLVVRAENVLFRVSGAMLAARSPVFADMLGFSQPDDAERIEGCPVVDLPDTAEDVKVFFKALFDYDFFQPYPERTEYATVVSVLRLSNKYEVGSLRKRALVHLGSAFTHRNTPHEGSLSDIWYYSSGSKASYTVPDHALPSLIRVGREVSALWILPSAFYRYSKIFDQRDILFNHLTPSGDPILSQEDQFCALSGALALRTHKMSEFLNFLWHPEDIPGCSHPIVCRIQRYATRRWAEGQRYLLPLDLPIKIGEMAVCSVCAFFLNEALRTARAELQDSMPAIFNLPSWTELEAMKLAALQ
ncbi:hypothetical protein DFH06DRAFT_1159044 [Mycena polygramma]|nr:hypothetical protein DFH06DRAFT_1159044 [Mycena polygramma]